MSCTTYTKMYVGDDYSTAQETVADIEGKVIRNTPHQYSYS